MARNRHPHRINSFGFRADPKTDRPHRISHARALALVAEFLANWIAPDAIQLRAPIGAELPTGLDKQVGWNIPQGRLRASCLNEGRCGQFTIGYPIPYAFEGHLRMPKAALVNYAG